MDASETETRKEKFTRLAEARTTAALQKIELLGNLTRSNYEYDARQAQMIVNAILSAVTDLKRKFEKAKKADKAGFTFELSGGRRNLELRLRPTWRAAGRKSSWPSAIYARPFFGIRLVMFEAAER